MQSVKRSILTLVVLTMVGLAGMPAVNAQHSSQIGALSGPGTFTAPITGSDFTSFSTYTTSANGNTLTFTDVSNTFQLRTMGNGNFNGNFSPGARVLWTQSWDPTTVPLTISFAQGVGALSFQAQTLPYGSETFDFTAYDGAQVIGNFSVTGISADAINNPALYGTAPYIGVKADPGYAITSLVLSSTNGIGLSDVTFALPSDASVAPEGSSLALFAGPALFGGFCLVRRRLRRS